MRTHSSRGLSGIQQRASAQAHTLPGPAPSLPALGTSRAPFAPPAWWGSVPLRSVLSVARWHTRVAGGGYSWISHLPGTTHFLGTHHECVGSSVLPQGKASQKADGGLRCLDLKLHCADGFDYGCNINSSIPFTGTPPAVLGW